MSEQDERLSHALTAPSPRPSPKGRGSQAVLLTPAGRGAVATIRVEGAAAGEMVSHRFRPHGATSLEQRPADRIVVGHWAADGEAEEVVVARRGDDVIEIHCHGGAAASRRILDDLVSLGCREIAWRDWINEREPDPIAAAALVALASAPTERTAAILLDQYAGALRREIGSICRAVFDKPRVAEEKLTALLRQAQLGAHLLTPWRVVLSGPPNVGKSSLINALVGFERAIVHHEPGTTRDVVTATTALDGWPVELADTAGLRTSDDPIEAAGVEVARRQLASADCVLLVFDAAQRWTAAEQQLVDDSPAALIVHNKCDLQSAVVDRQGDGRPHGLWTSALRGDGLEMLLKRIMERLVPTPAAPGQGVPFTLEQVSVLDQALIALRRREVSTASQVLAQLGPKQPKAGESGPAEARFDRPCAG